ncbi:MAG: apolipoprotein N-acyltransferase [Ignavibacteria bacterium]
MKFKNIDKKIFLQVIIAGIFYGLSFPPVNLNFLIYFSFVLIIDVLLKSIRLKQIFLRTYGVFFTAGLLAISWIGLSGMRDNADSFLIIAGVFVLFIYPLFFIPPAILFYFINKNFSSGKLKYISLIIFPFLWTAFEYIQTLGQINFPWLFAGNTQSYNLNKIQFAEYTGVFGVSFWICVTSVALYVLFNKLSAKSWKILSPKSITVFALIIIIFFLPDLFNVLNKNTFTESGKIKIGIVQPNIDPWEKWSGKQNDLINDYLDQIRKICSQDREIQLIVLPETALPYYFKERHFEERYLLIKDLCDSINIPIVIGTPDLQYYDNQPAAPDDAKIMKSSGLKYDTYNTAVLFEPGKDKNIYQKHHKIKLVIGSERLPYKELLPFAKNLVEWGVGLSSWQIGEDTNIFALPDGVTFNTAICYESVYPEFFAGFVNKGADFSVIITNDGWWGKFFGTYQHNQFAVFRAIENRRWIARCANTGISDFLDPQGKMYLETPINEKRNIIFEIGLIQDKTFFCKHGDLFSKVCFYAGVLVFAISFFFRKGISSP